MAGRSGAGGRLKIRHGVGAGVRLNLFILKPDYSTSTLLREIHRIRPFISLSSPSHAADRGLSARWYAFLCLVRVCGCMLACTTARTTTVLEMTAVCTSLYSCFAHARAPPCAPRRRPETVDGGRACRALRAAPRRALTGRRSGRRGSSRVAPSVALFWRSRPAAAWCCRWLSPAASGRHENALRPR